MKFEEVPVGFGMALIQNTEATNAFAMMTHAEKQAIWKKARSAKSQEEMRRIVDSIAAQ